MSNPGDTTPYGASQTIYQQVVRQPSNGMAIAALVLGIIAIAFGVWSVIPILGLFAAFTAFVPAVLAVVFGAIGRTKSTTLGGIGRGQAITGLVLGAVTLAIIVLTTLWWIVVSLSIGASETYADLPNSMSGLGA